MTKYATSSDTASAVLTPPLFCKVASGFSPTAAFCLIKLICLIQCFIYMRFVQTPITTIKTMRMISIRVGRYSMRI